MSEVSPAVAALWRAARTLSRRAGQVNPPPPLWLFTDPVRTPDPAAAAERLPIGAGVVFRAFDAADAVEMGLRLAAVARARSLTLLAGQDAELARKIGAAGVHLPERRLADARALRLRQPDWLITGTAHSRTSLRRAARLPLNAIFASPALASDSPSASEAIGPGRLRAWIADAGLPVYVLGGVNAASAYRLRNTGAAGLAAVSGLLV